MDTFIRRQTVKRYQRLIEMVIHEPDRQRLLGLLGEEQQRQRDAGDPVEVELANTAPA